jgi:adhesin/invasin
MGPLRSRIGHDRLTASWSGRPRRRLLRCLALSVLGVFLFAAPALAARPFAAGPGGAAAAPAPALADTVSVMLSPTSITADGISQTTATATVTLLGIPVDGETVGFTSSDPGELVTVNAPTGGGTGQYTATITSSTAANPSITITATDSTSAISGTATLAQTAGPPALVSVGLSPTSITANGSSQTTATATVTDTNGNPIDGETVSFSSSDSGETVGSTTATGGGTGQYTAKITSSKTAGPVTITATDGTLTGTAQLTQTPGPPAHIGVTLNPASITANGSSQTTATATVTDANGNHIDGQTVSFSSSDSGETVGSTTPTGGGTGQYTAKITSSKTAGPVTITATDGTLTGTAQLTQTAGAPAHIAVTLNPTAIPADGTSQTTATATVTDTNGNRVDGESVSFSSSDTGETVGSTTAIGGGTGQYTAKITSSKTAGPVTITATDGTVTGTAQLTQTAGAPAHIAVALNPTAIAADGTSQTTATATVTDTSGNPLDGESIAFTSSDVGDVVSSTTPTGGGSGRYTATLTASTFPGTPIITARVAGTSVQGQTILTQTAGLSATSLTVPPGSPRTNQSETLVATVQQAPSFGSPNGTMSFRDGGSPIPGCGAVALSPSGSVATALCQTSFAASGSPAKLTAVYSGVGNVAGSTSPEMDLGIGVDGTSTRLTSSVAQPTAGGTVRYTATVTPSHSGPVNPTGTIAFDDGGTALSGCASHPVTTANGASTATCTVKFARARKHAITARYSGDRNFAHSVSSQLTTTVLAPSTIGADLAWTFHYTPTSTTVPALAAQPVPSGGRVVVICHGKGCPFVKRTLTPGKVKRCSGKGSKRTCTTVQSHSVDLAPAFRRHSLGVGTKLIVELLHTGKVGKYFRFTMRSGAPPATFSSCLAPGGTKPGVGCSLS